MRDDLIRIANNIVQQFAETEKVETNRPYVICQDILKALNGDQNPDMDYLMLQLLLKTACEYGWKESLSKLLGLNRFSLKENIQLTGIEDFVAFLNKSDKDFYSSGNNKNLLHTAAFHGRPEIVEYLLDECGVNPNAPDTKFDRPLHHAVYGNTYPNPHDTQKTIKSTGTDHAQVVHILLMNGAQISQKNNAHKSAYDVMQLEVGLPSRWRGPSALFVPCSSFVYGGTVKPFLDLAFQPNQAYKIAFLGQAAYSYIATEKLNTTFFDTEQLKTALSQLTFSEAREIKAMIQKYPGYNKNASGSVGSSLGFVGYYLSGSYIVGAVVGVTSAWATLDILWKTQHYAANAELRQNALLDVLPKAQKLENKAN